MLKNEIEIDHVKANVFVRDKTSWSIKSKEFLKLYRIVYDKRILLSDFSTIPFGYKI